MNTPEIVRILFAGSAFICWSGVIVNITAPHFYRYREHLPTDAAMRCIFIAQAVWVTMFLAAMGAASVWGVDLMRMPLNYFALFMLLIWLSRLLLQLVWWPTLGRLQPIRWVLFTIAFVYQVTLFSCAFAGVLS